MTNKEIYKKTLTFSIRGLVVDLVSFLILGGLCVLGFVIVENVNGKGLIGLAIGLVLGIIAVALISRFTTYSIKAGQIAMMTRGVVENNLPDNVYAEGKRVVKERFKTVAALFAVTSVIKGIFRQIGKGITAIGNAVGGDAGGTVGSVISSAIQTLIAYLCDCCLGWVFFRKEVNAARATCEGAVLFFKHGKTLARNAGRIFGMGLASLLLIGGAFTGIAYLIFMNIPGAFAALSNEIGEAATRLEAESIPEFISNPTTLMIVCAVIVGLIIWSVIHSTFIRPFILVGVLRNYMESGMNDIPDEASFSMLKGKSAKFDKLRSEI